MEAKQNKLFKGNVNTKTILVTVIVTIIIAAILFGGGFT